MTKIPLSVFFMTSTKGHWNQDTYLSTLKSFERQIPWGDISVKVVHIKITPGSQAKAAEMIDELERRGFKVLTSTADWQRGVSHQLAYNSDLVKVSKEPSLYLNQFCLFLEDDSTLTCHKHPLREVLSRMVAFLEASPDLLTTRFIRRADYEGGVPILDTIHDVFFSPNYDFQPSVIRCRDFYLAAKIIEANPEAQQAVQIEMLWRTVLDQFSRAPVQRHLVWHPDYCESIHLGTQDYPALKASLNL